MSTALIVMLAFVGFCVFAAIVIYAAAWAAGRDDELLSTRDRRK